MNDIKITYLTNIDTTSFMGIGEDFGDISEQGNGSGIVLGTGNDSGSGYGIYYHLRYPNLLGDGSGGWESYGVGCGHFNQPGSSNSDGTGNCYNFEFGNHMIKSYGSD